MRCPQCLQTVPESTKHCQCGFAFDDVAAVDLQDWFTQNQQTLEAAYTEARTPWQQSGKSGIFEDWVRLRIANLAPIQRSGSYLDIGCANGYLLECLVVWARLKGLQLIPHGLGFSAKLVALARQRLPTTSYFYVGNAWNWMPPQRFDYVRAELDYVPRNYRQPFVERLLATALNYRLHADDSKNGVNILTIFR